LCKQQRRTTHGSNSGQVGEVFFKRLSLLCFSSLFFFSSSPTIFVAHHNLTSLYPHASFHLILPRPYPVSLSCIIPLTCHAVKAPTTSNLNPASSSSLSQLDLLSNTSILGIKAEEHHHRADLARLLVDLRTSRPAFQSNTSRTLHLHLQRSTFWDRILAQNDSSLNYDTLLDDADHALPHLVPGAFRHSCFCAG
jgi:hypothetical protein